MNSKNLFLVLYFFIMCFCIENVWSQEANDFKISEMEWGNDYDLHLKLNNDSSFIYDIKGLYHYNNRETNNSDSNSFTYYPVALGNEFVQQLKNRNLKIENEKFDSTLLSNKPTTLWSALHNSIGGGWVHFVNCMLYTLESGQLEIDAPLMQRPISNWKPKPMTESYKRTKKWKYYVPVHQKYAKKEYKIRKKNNNLGDLEALPPSFIKIFLSTSQKKYELYKADRNNNVDSEIDIIKILLGANYLSKMQIEYIQSRVLNSILQYSENQLPKVIILDDYHAAVAMSLDESGYQIEKIVFDNQDKMNEVELEFRIEKIETIINNINIVNKKVFQDKLKKYYN